MPEDLPIQHRHRTALFLNRAQNAATRGPAVTDLSATLLPSDICLVETTFRITPQKKPAARAPLPLRSRDPQSILQYIARRAWAHPQTKKSVQNVAPAAVQSLKPPAAPPSLPRTWVRTSIGKAETKPATQPARKKPAPRSWKRRCATGCTIALLSAVTLEGGSFAAYWALTGSPLSFGQAAEEQQRIAAEAMVTDPNLLASGGDGKLSQLIVHPYMGYTRKIDHVNNVPGQDYLLGLKPLIAASPGTAIIGIFGGSVAEQFSQAGSGVLKHLLSQDPRFAGKDLVIFTAAIGGFKQPQQLMSLNYLLSLGQHFDAIVNIDGFNEVAGPSVSNIPKNVSPYYPSGWYHLAGRLPDTRVLEHIGAVAYSRKRRKDAASLMLSSTPLGHSTTAQFLWKGWDGMLASRVAESELALLEQPSAQVDDTLQRGLPYDYRGDEQLLADLVEQWKRSSLLMHGIAKAEGIPYFHFLQPNQYVPDTKLFSATERRTALNVESPYRRWVMQGYPILREAGKDLQKQGVDFHDLTGLYARVPETIYKDDCCHVNTLGNAILGQIVVDAILGDRNRLARL
ncbi:MAG TPA: hypothetical protein DEB30_04560 [Candidatus Peribacter riflensis]|nr:MAG: hypothetical protein A2398_03280 [Candidatus Peribacteria bacterium RIFOXYB1_FULL_57_12]OGJ79687.1 MAG: hypothetical protein A2412_01930 [Candidatus Peribacteria bacterium RIFOXYC1_FULL_58_8]HBH19769.1 hypothetical protein [Candidatus Peribacter riflensis]HBU10036.1 hypothetical protein [Candidatus Peribacter riflensis]